MTSVYVTDQEFENFNINDQLKLNLARKEYTQPTKIQDKAIPEILNGKDIIGLASTGSGKTAAFLVPMINKAIEDPMQKCLIIVPTRELASQIDDEFYKLTYQTDVRSAVVIGGTSMYRQIRTLEGNPQFVIGTPGRLKDLSQRNRLRLEQFNNIVLDEVDRMLDMGFIHDIKELMSKLQKERQTLFFSATMPPKVEYVANSLLNSPVKIQIETQSPAKNVDQNIIKAKTYSEKIQKLHELLIKDECKKALIFSRTRRGTDSLSTELIERGFRADAIHGYKSQNIRTKVIKKFRNDDIDVLVATDVAARGLDIPAISHVINYDEPANYNDYIHRIGRTGRVGKKGYALTFVS
jgi:superfamily II DNA/RNA helicase